MMCGAAGATLVVFHTSVLYQVPAPRRQAFVELVRALPGHWVANDTPDALPGRELPEPPSPAAHNLLALDGTPEPFRLEAGDFFASTARERFVVRSRIAARPEAQFA